MLWTNAINLGTGIAILLKLLHSQKRQLVGYVFFQFGIPYLSISVSLNVLLTLMIIIRLVLHGRNVRAAAGSAAGISELCKEVSTVLVESCALFAVSSLVVVGALVVFGTSDNPDISLSGGYTVDIFFPILVETQVRTFTRPSGAVV